MKISYEGKRQFTASERGHSITVDLPEAKGGEDTGLTPPELLSASLGTCIGVYVTSYCESVGVDCTGMTIEVKQDMAENPNRIGRLHAKVHIPGGVPENRMAAVKKVAGHCLIHQTLCSLPELTIEIG